MNRSIGFERTVQKEQFQPVKVSTYVNDIPQYLWENAEFMEGLSKLLIVQVYKTLTQEKELVREFQNATDDAMTFLGNMERNLLENLDLSNVNIQTSKE